MFTKIVNVRETKIATTKLICIKIIKILIINVWLVGQWVFWVWVRFYLKPNFLMDFLVFKPISTKLPDPTHFYDFFWMSLIGFYWLTQPMYTHSSTLFHLSRKNSFIIFIKILRHFVIKGLIILAFKNFIYHLIISLHHLNIFFYEKYLIFFHSYHLIVLYVHITLLGFWSFITSFHLHQNYFNE